jgi:cytochrome b561
MIVLILGAVKIGWQLYTPPPAAAGALKPWERMAAAGVHHLLLLLMVLIPVTGYLISTSDGKSVDVFGWFQVPALVGKNDTVRDMAITLHFYLAYAVGLLAVGHAGAALKHQFIDKDGTLARMIWK